MLKRIQDDFPQILSLGCHSSKFSNEKSKYNILSALKRHLISHPVACDSDLDIWKNLGIICWPTILVISPDGLIIGEFIGEVNCNYLRKFIQISSKFYENKLSVRKIKFDQKKHILEQVQKSLLYPTKLNFNKEQNLLFISDSGNNRVLGYDVTENSVKFEISSQKCFEKSIFIECCMNWPQGIAYDNHLKTLFIADTFNNVIRSVNLNNKESKILCGTGARNSIGLYDLKGGKKGLDQEISSPWDLKLMEKENSKILLIACVGTHQIWLYSFQNKSIDSPLKNLLWWKNLSIEWDSLICVAGNGKERNKNNVYPLQASFAQPSGLCFDDNYNCFIADAESSTIRIMSLKDGSVKGFIGGDNLDPDNLFAYGDQDGKGYEAKLQHPLDVCFLKNNFLIVADSYNNSLKLIDIKTKLCRKIFIQNSDLNEPNGICIDENNGYLWIADTNNHSIKFFRVDDIFKEKEIIFSNILLDQSVDSVDYVQKIDKLKLNDQKFIEINFNFKLNESAENFWTVKVNERTITGLFTKNNLFHKIFLENFEKIFFLELHINVAYCQMVDNDSICKLLNKKIVLNESELFALNQNGHFIINDF